MPVRVEICGVTGAGKTSLCLALHDTFFSKVEILLDEYRKVPFWEECWSLGGVHELERDIGFLLHHHYLAMKAEHCAICDFSFLDDLAYSKLLPDSADIGIFQSVYDRLQIRRSMPALVVHLDCSVSTALERIARRSRPEERNVPATFLEKLKFSINAVLSQFRAKNDPIDIITIDTDQFDIRIKDHQDAIFSKIEPAMRRFID